MTRAQTILTVGRNQIDRAELRSGGNWVVEPVLRGIDPQTIASDPNNANTIYAGTQNDGVYRSDDRGRTWRPCGLAGRCVKSVAVSPHDSDTVFAGLRPAGVARTDDGGQTWMHLDGFQQIPNRWWWLSPAEKPFRAYVLGLAVSPDDPDVVIAGVEFGAVVRSADGGHTWSGHRSGALRDCHSLTFHANKGQWAYEAGGTGAGAAFSTDGGQTWQQPRTGLAHNYGVACAADSQRPDLWYVAVAPGPGNAFGDKPEAHLYRSADAGAWEPIGWEPHPMSEMPAVLVTDPVEPGHLYAGTRHGHIWHTADYGDSWQRLDLRMESIWLTMVIA